MEEGKQSEPAAVRPAAAEPAIKPDSSTRTTGDPSTDSAPAPAVQSSPATQASEPESLPAKPAAPPTVLAAYEHPWVIRFTHWLNAICIFALTASGLRIFRAFPSFGPKIPQHDFVDIPKALTLGGWLGGALQWHFTFMWLFIGSGVLYVGYQLLSRHYRTVLFSPKDIAGVWPMIRYYFLFGRKPEVSEQYNPLQKLAYSATVLCGLLSLITGLVLYKPVQFSWLAWPLGGYHLTRIWHFVAMCGFLAFIPGHLIMVLLHGWSNFYSMLAGWKRDPEYLSE